MQKEIETYELIEQYLKGSLNAEEKGKVLQQIKGDPNFAAEVEKHKQLQNFIFETSILDIKGQINDIHKKHSGNNNRFGFKNLLSYLGAFIIFTAIILIIAGKNRIKKNSFIKEADQKVMLNEKEMPTNSISSTATPAQSKEQTVSQPRPPKQETATDSIFKTKPQHEEVTTHTEQIIQNGETAPEHLNSVIEPVNTKTKEEIKEIPIIHETNATEETTHNCENVVIDADIATESSCNNKASGKIIVDWKSITGGTSPYYVSIDGGKNFYSEFSISNLPPSVYILYIKDADNCMSKLGNYSVDQVDCTYEFVFSPDKGEVWKIPTQNSTGEITIYQKSGKTVFTEVFDMPGNYEWNGRTNNGYELPMGVYLFVLNLENNQPLYGTVTIVR